MLRQALATLLLATATTSVATADEPRERDPASSSKGKVASWKTSDGLAYHYIVPKSYDAGSGSPLTIVLHGSNLSRAWGFANHKAGNFRPDDIVVSPDGTTANGRGGFNSFGKPADVARFSTLIGELKAALKVTAVYLYGHSQGSFFALHYAGSEPDNVDGVVAHASGIWNWTPLPEALKDKPIVLLHGTADPIVPYSQSIGGVAHLRKQGFTKVRLRSLEGWGHWPAEHNGPLPHTSQQLAWVEGLHTTSPERLAAAFGTLTPSRDRAFHDFAALHQVAGRILDLPASPASAKTRAGRAIELVETLAEKHAASLDAPGDTAATDIGPWIGHLPVFLRSFAGLDATTSLRTVWQPKLDTHRKNAAPHIRNYRNATRNGDKLAAFTAAIAALRDGYLAPACAAPSFLDQVEALAKDARKFDAPKELRDSYRADIAPLVEALNEGRERFESINERGR